MNKARAEQLVKVGCIICRKQGRYTAPSIHHLRKGMGMGQRNTDDKTIPLCPYHHQWGKRPDCLHQGKDSFESKWGMEEDLLLEVNTLIEGDV